MLPPPSTIKKLIKVNKLYPLMPVGFIVVIIQQYLSKLILFFNFIKLRGWGLGEGLFLFFVGTGV
jgi:hypothetical protein